MTNQECKTYEDIINLPHPSSKTHPRMAAIDRAAQFSPFAALTGYEKVLENTEKTVIDRVTHEVETETVNNIREIEMDDA